MPAGWAFAAVMSRAFRLRGHAYPPALLPLIDMANHAPAEHANCHVRATPAIMLVLYTAALFIMVAQRDLGAALRAGRLLLWGSGGAVRADRPDDYGTTEWTAGSRRGGGRPHHKKRGVAGHAMSCASQVVWVTFW
jgi:hypothetical protein